MPKNLFKAYNKEDFIGKKYNLLTITDVYIKTYSGKRRSFAKCNCDCGNSMETGLGSILEGNTKSCGCLNSYGRCKHGNAKRGEETIEYKTWGSIKGRCYNPKNAKYPIYGGRCIVMDEVWLNDFNQFLYDMGKRPNNYSIDRFPDKDGNCTKNNCRWASIVEQNRNRKNTLRHEYLGKKQTIAEWANEVGSTYNNFYNHIREGKKVDDIIKFYIKKYAKINIDRAPRQ